MVTKQAVLDYLTIDDCDDAAGDEMVSRRIERCIKSAEGWIKESVCEQVDMEDALAEELLIKAAGELYENRSFAEKGGINSKATAALNRMAADFAMQLRCKYGGDV